MPALILRPGLPPTRLSLVVKAGREGLPIACLAGAAAGAPSAEMGTVAGKGLVYVRSFPLRLHFPSARDRAQRSCFCEMQNRLIRAPPRPFRPPSTNGDT